MVAVSCKTLIYDRKDLPERVVASIWPRDATFDKFCQKCPPDHFKHHIFFKKKNDTCAWTPNKFSPFLIYKLLGAWLGKSRQVGGDGRNPDRQAIGSLARQV